MRGDRVILTALLILVLGAQLWISGRESEKSKKLTDDALAKSAGAVSLAEELGIRVNQQRLDHNALLDRMVRAERTLGEHHDTIKKSVKLMGDLDHKMDSSNNRLQYLEMKLSAEMGKPRQVVVSQNEPWLFRRSDLPLKKSTDITDAQRKKVIENVKNKLREMQPAVNALGNGKGK